MKEEKGSTKKDYHYLHTSGRMQYERVHHFAAFHVQRIVDRGAFGKVFLDLTVQRQENGSCVWLALNGSQMEGSVLGKKTEIIKH